MVDLIKAELKHAKRTTSQSRHSQSGFSRGEVLASDEIYHEIDQFQKKKGGKPVIASMGNLAASGGYYVCAPCRWIVANDLTITGSIGVILHSWNYRGLMNKVGLRPKPTRAENSKTC